MRSFVLSPVALSKLITFVMFYYISMFNFLIFTYYVVPYAYASLQQLDCILLLLLALNAILLTSSVSTLFFMPLNLCVFNFDLLPFKNSLRFSFRLSPSPILFSKCFILFSSWSASRQEATRYNLRI